MSPTKTPKSDPWVDRACGGFAAFALGSLGGLLVATLALMLVPPLPYPDSLVVIPLLLAGALLGGAAFAALAVRTGSRSSAARAATDHSPNERLPSGPGELWVGLRTTGDAQADDATLEAMVHHVETTGVGEWVGQSVGGGQRDVTFEVQDRRLARDRIARYFSGRLPTADFWISSEYQSIFDCDQRLDRS